MLHTTAPDSLPRLPPDQECVWLRCKARPEQPHPSYRCIYTPHCIHMYPQLQLQLVLKSVKLRLLKSALNQVWILRLVRPLTPRPAAWHLCLPIISRSSDHHYFLPLLPQKFELPRPDGTASFYCTPSAGSSGDVRVALQVQTLLDSSTLLRTSRAQPNNRWFVMTVGIESHPIADWCPDMCSPAHR
jgi:hypothetical protein